MEKSVVGTEVDKGPLGVWTDFPGKWAQSFLYYCYFSGLEAYESQGRSMLDNTSPKINFLKMGAMMRSSTTEPKNQSPIWLYSQELRCPKHRPQRKSLPFPRFIQRGYVKAESWINAGRCHSLLHESCGHGLEEMYHACMTNAWMNIVI